MSAYAIGDIQGCFDPLQALLAKADFNPSKDTLWVAGDLVNRGPNNLDVLRYIKSLGEQARVVLGNHDLHLLAVHAGVKSRGKKDTIQDVLEASDCEELIHWLRNRPLIYQQDSWVLSHAGVPHIWTASEASGYANEVSTALRSPDYTAFLSEMYGNEPIVWDNTLSGSQRLRVITNYLTRMRFVNTKGELELKAKQGVTCAPEGMSPWFKHDRRPEDINKQFLFGHWAAIEGQTGKSNFIGLDTGCVWGGCLTMLRLDDNTFFSTECGPTLSNTNSSKQ